MASQRLRARSYSGENYLQSFLTKHELSHVTRSTQDKINRHFNGKFEELSAVHSLLETTKSRLEETANELQTQVEGLNSELERSREKITSLEDEVLSLKSTRDAAVDENNKLTSQLQQKDAEINTLKIEAGELSDQLREAFESKSKYATLNNDLQSKQALFMEQKKRMEEEKAFLATQVSNLTAEVKTLKHDLQTTPLEHLNKVMKLESDLADVTSQLTTANRNISKANEENKILLEKIDFLQSSMTSQAEMANNKIDNYKHELETSYKMAEHNKTQYQDAVEKINDLTAQYGDLQNEYQKLNKLFNELETKYKEAEDGIRDNEIITSLRQELDHAKQLLSAAKEENLSLMTNMLTPSAAALSKILKCDMSITQIYSQLININEQLKQEKQENINLNNIIEKTKAQLNEKIIIVENANDEKEKIIQKNMEAEQNLKDVTSQRDKLKEEFESLSQQFLASEQEIVSLNRDLSDMGRQVCYLLQEVENSRSTDDAEPNKETTDASKTLVTFRNVEELQKNNQELLRKVRELTEKQQHEEHNNINSAYLELSIKVKRLEISVSNLKETESSLKSMLGTSMRQRNMYKALLDDYMKAKRQEYNFETTATEELMDTSCPENSESELTKARKQLECLKKEYDIYKQEKDINHKILREENEKMRQEVYLLTISNNRSTSSADFTEKRAQLLECNLDLCRKLITSLEMRNSMYKETNSKYEELFKKLRDESLDALKQLATAEVLVEKYKLECKLLKDTETRLRAENEVLNRERQSQGIVAKNLEMIKICLQRSEAEKIGKLELRLQESARDCDSHKRKYDEQVEKLKALELQLNTQVETSNKRIQEEKSIANAMRTEIAQLRQDLFNRNKSNEELGKKLKIALTSDNSANSYEFIKQLKEYENEILDKNNIVQSLQQQLSEANEHVKEITDKYKKDEENYKDMIKKHEAKLASTEKLLEVSQNRIKALEDELLLLQSNSFSNVDDDQKRILITLSKCQQELSCALTEIKELTAKFNASEEKYAHEALLHSHDIQELTEAKRKLSALQNNVKETIALKDGDMKKMENELMRSKEAEEALRTEYQQLVSRFEELNTQNNLLHEQMESFSTQLSHSRSHSESMNESGNKSQINTSINEDEITCPEQLLKIIKCIRKEKNIIVAKSDIYEAETVRLKAQLVYVENQLMESNDALNKLRKTLDEKALSVDEHTELHKKVELLDAITDSNRLLRNERDFLLKRVEELMASTNAHDAEVTPLQANITELTSKNTSLELENTNLKSETETLKRDLIRLKNRVNALADRQNKTSPEDWKRLQNERETLAKMLTSEKDNVSKLSQELKLFKNDYDDIVEKNAKLNEELNLIKTEQIHTMQELFRLNNEMKDIKEKNVKLREGLLTKETLLSNLGNSQTQIKKIAKKYKEQYAELADAAERESELTTSKLAELKIECEKLRSELATSIKNDEQSRNELKLLNDKIIELTEENKVIKADAEAKEKQHINDNEKKLSELKTQHEDEVKKLQKEMEDALTEKNKEIEDLISKVNLLERQLSRQSNESKQIPAEKPATIDPPTANIKLMTGAPQRNPSKSQEQSRRSAAEPVHVSTRPLTQVEPSGPDTHSTEYMPASSSRTIPTAQTESMQTVALTVPRLEHQGISASPAASTSKSSASTANFSAGKSNSSAGTGPPSGGGKKSSASGSESTGVSTSLAPQTRNLKRTRSRQQADNKKMRVQEVSRSEDVEYQVPTSSRYDQDDDSVVIVDSDEGPYIPSMYRTRLADDDDDEVVVTEERSDSSRPQSSRASSHSLPDNAGRLAHSSSDIDPLGFSDSLSGDRLAPLKPVMYLTRRAETAPNVPQTSYTGRAARILYSEAGMSGQRTLLELESPTPARRSSRNISREEQGSTVSSQGSGAHSLHRVQEEGREAEASLGPPRRRSYRSQQLQLQQQQQLQESLAQRTREEQGEDSETSSSIPIDGRATRGRGGRKRGARRKTRAKR